MIIIHRSKYARNAINIHNAIHNDILIEIGKIARLEPNYLNFRHISFVIPIKIVIISQSVTVYKHVRGVRRIDLQNP